MRREPALTLIAATLAAAIPLAGRVEISPLLARALAAGLGSRQAVALILYWAAVAIWTVLALTRAETRLSRRPGLPAVLTVRTALRKSRRIHLGAVRRVMLVSVSLIGVTDQRAFLVDGAGNVLARPRHHRGLWQRDDARALLDAAGIAVEWDHRRTRPRDIERVYPGSLPWLERNGLVYALAVASGMVVAAVTVGWVFFGE